MLITGASSGLGRATARHFADLGARPVLTARNADGLAETARSCAPVDTLVHAADLTLPGDIARLATFVENERGSVDILINNAGVGLYAPSFEAAREDVESMVRLNLLAPIELTRRVLPLMPAGGTVVNISSIAGKVPLPWLTVYSATKFGLNAFSDGLRMELSGTGIHVLCVCPGFVDTKFRDNVLQGRIPDDVAGSKRFSVTAEECAATIADGIRRRKRTIVTPRIGWMLHAAAALFPRAVFARMGRMADPAQCLLGARRGS